LGSVERLERGDLRFFFRPVVQAAEADEVVLGVQSLFAILSAEHGVHRRMRIGKKRMPRLARERFWARIERVGSLQRVLGDTLEPEHYTTKTRGDRYQPGARPIAHGTYELLSHHDHVHFTYAIEPFGFEDAPDEIELAPRGDHLLLFKAPADSRAVWTPRPDITELDREHAQLVICGACRSSDADRALQSSG
jgi:hypothetical protein